MVSKSADPLTRDRGFESGSLQRRDPLTRDRGFESISLQQRVCELSVPQRRTMLPDLMTAIYQAWRYFLTRLHPLNARRFSVTITDDSG